MTRDDLIGALTNDNISAFLHVIRAGETSQNPIAYQTLFGGGTFDSYADHPRQVIVRGKLKSTAAGAYQFLAGTWDNLVKQYGFSDFSPPSQDQGAVALIAGRKALDDVIAGRLDAAIRKCNREWASLPGSPYGQPTRTFEQAAQVFTEYGGTIADSPLPLAPLSQPTEVKPVGIFAALLPSLLPLIPQLGALFGSGSEVSNRNVAAATAVTKALTEATNSPNLQAAIETMQGDPALLKAGQDAVNAIWQDITEAGGGGIDGARKQVVATAEVPLFKQAPFILALLFFCLAAFVVVLSMLKFEWIAEITPETRAGVIMFVLGTIIGGVVSFYYGTMHKPQDAK